MFFADDLPIKLVTVPLLFLKDLIAPGFEVSKTLVQASRSAAVNNIDLWTA